MNEWIEQYKQYHANENTNYPGNNLKPQLHHIKDLVIDTKVSLSNLNYNVGYKRSKLFITITKLEGSRTDEIKCRHYESKLLWQKKKSHTAFDYKSLS